MTPKQARQELTQMREQAAQGKRFKSHAEAMDDFYQMMAGPSPEMQRTRSTLADYY
ncbi:hypothetical protein [Pseudaeromonas pectinilytica]